MDHYWQGQGEEMKQEHPWDEIERLEGEQHLDELSLETAAQIAPKIIRKALLDAFMAGTRAEPGKSPMQSFLEFEKRYKE